MGLCQIWSGTCAKLLLVTRERKQSWQTVNVSLWGPSVIYMYIWLSASSMSSPLLTFAFLGKHSLFSMNFWMYFCQGVTDIEMSQTKRAEVVRQFTQTKTCFTPHSPQRWMSTEQPITHTEHFQLNGKREHVGKRTVRANTCSLMHRSTPPLLSQPFTLFCTGTTSRRPLKL